MAVALFATLVASATSSAAPGSLDTTFGAGGKVTTSFSGSAEQGSQDAMFQKYSVKTARWSSFLTCSVNIAL